MDGAGARGSLPRPLVPDASWKVTASHDGRPAPQANAEGGYNYHRRRRRRAELPGLDDRRPAAGRHVVSTRVAGAAVLTEIQFTSSPIGGRAGAPRSMDLSPALSGAGISGWQCLECSCCGRRRQSGNDGDHVRTNRSKVRSNHADCGRRQRAAVVDAAPSPLCGVRSDGAIAVLVMTPPCVRHRRIRLIVARSRRRGDRAQLLLRARFESAAELISERPDFRVGRIGRCGCFFGILARGRRHRAGAG